MAHFYFSANTGNGRTLVIAPLNDRLLSECDEVFADTSGYFLFEKRVRGEIEDIEVIAHVPNDEAALRLKALIGMS